MPAVVVLSVLNLTNILHIYYYLLELMILIVRVYKVVHSTKYYTVIKYVYSIISCMNRFSYSDYSLRLQHAKWLNMYSRQVCVLKH